MTLPDPHMVGRSGPFGLAIAAIALGLVYYWAGRMEFVPIDLVDISLRQFGELLASYLFLALMIERAVELILNWRFGAETIAALAPLKQGLARNATEMQMLARDLELFSNPKDRGIIVDDEAARVASEARRTLPAQAARTRERLDRLSQNKRRWATWCSVGLSTGLALSGFQMLHGAFHVQGNLTALPAMQMQVFSFLDICLTAIVLAGGAGGIHTIISRLLDFGQTSKTGGLPE